jgi:hypothetical protein
VTAAHAVETDVPALAGLGDPRLRGWRAVLADASAAALRNYQQAWTHPDLDDAGRAVAAIGALDGGPVLSSEWSLGLSGDGTLAALAGAAELDLADEAMLAAAWWSTVDPQVAVAFGCLHDDASRRYATLGLLALTLRSFGVQIPLAISQGHRLVTAGLLGPVPDADTPLRLPPTTSSILAGQRAEPPVVAALPARLADVAERAAALVAIGANVLVRSPLAADLPAVRDAVAARIGMPVATVQRSAEVARLLLRLGLELPSAVLVPGDEPPDGAVLACGGAGTAPAPGWHVLDLDAPAQHQAQRCWRHALRSAAIRANAGDVADLAGRMPMAESSIGSIVDKAVTSARAKGHAPTLADVSAMLRAHPRHDLVGLARRLPPAIRLADLVLTDRTRDGLAELVAHARYSIAVSADMELTSSRGQAVIALFHGASGTGKTAAAEAVAADLDRDLWVVDLARVVSKWLGETQRNLDAVLREAADAGAVLLFDEADGLFGKRGEVTDARDRYANLEIDHLLQRVELHSGVVILTSNRPAALDEAFARRIRLSVRFDMPDHAQREELWRRVLPAAMLAEGASPEVAAREQLSGAAIRSVALAAAVLAVDDGTGVTNAHLSAAVSRELDKQKRPPTARGGQR